HAGRGGDRLRAGRALAGFDLALGLPRPARQPGAGPLGRPEPVRGHPFGPRSAGRPARPVARDLGRRQAAPSLGDGALRGPGRAVRRHLWRRGCPPRGRRSRPPPRRRRALPAVPRDGGPEDQPRLPRGSGSSPLRGDRRARPLASVRGRRALRALAPAPALAASDGPRAGRGRALDRHGRRAGPPAPERRGPVKDRGPLVPSSLALVALFAASEARGQAGLLVPTSRGRPDASVLALRDMVIDVGIARGYARVNVLQIFENNTATPQEGTYRFRLPPSGVVGDFAVWDDLQRIPGVILEKQRARAIYRELTSQRIDPGLLQQGEEEAGVSGRPSGGAAFSVRVAPIPAWATKRVELQFQQEVPFVQGQGEFRLGLAPPDGEPPGAGTLTVHVNLL